MDIDEIRNMPIVVNTVEHGLTHESIFRAWHILQEVKRLLSLGTPAQIVMELITEMEKTAAPSASGGDSEVTT